MFITKQALALGHSASQTMGKIAPEAIREFLKLASRARHGFPEDDPTPSTALRIKEVHCNGSGSIEACQSQSPTSIRHKYPKLGKSYCNSPVRNPRLRLRDEGLLQRVFVKDHRDQPPRQSPPRSELEIWMKEKFGGLPPGKGLRFPKVL
jgi:hypothetical protein